jgi:hypothetical protein
MNEYEIVALAGEQHLQPPGEVGRVEEPHGRRNRRGQARQHAGGLHRVPDHCHLEARAVRRDAPAFLGLPGRTGERGDRDRMTGAGEVPDHVERPDFPAALRRKRKAVTDVEYLQAFLQITFESSINQRITARCMPEGKDNMRHRSESCTGLTASVTDSCGLP